mmetsp:Transcript_17062/g.50951  ORF Transcript_17062/g.50951 Transcript_17062/m.50951 type:complete len:580 (+) Transcript_17062:168-1907(+)
MQQLGRSATLSRCIASYVRPASSCIRGQQAPQAHTGPQAAHRLAWGPSERAQLLRPAQAVAAAEPDTDTNQRIREGDTEAALVQLQADKDDDAQERLADALPAYSAAAGLADAAVVGCGPAGLSLAAELAKRGVKVVLIGHDVPFVNNYGVWEDEFRELGLSHTLNATWKDALCYFGEGQEVRVGRPYARVCRRKLRSHLVAACRDAGVAFVAGDVSKVDAQAAGAAASLTCSGGAAIQARVVIMAAGAAAGKFLQYETDAPTMAAQTAYGIQAVVEGYSDRYDPESMLFMDFRRHHTGLWNETAPRLVPGEHPNAGENMWGTKDEVPSFLYAMPTEGGRSVFLEETCLVAKPALPFAVLKRRLERRLAALGIKVVKVEEEEWSYIPVGGPLPLPGQNIAAFGAAANLVHPATGYSITRSLREAPALAADLADILQRRMPVGQTAEAAWLALWTPEKRRQAAFHVFGMELLCKLPLASTNQFFATFFKLPGFYWRGFLASRLSSVQLIVFAMLTLVLAPPGIKLALVKHLVGNPAGPYLLRKYIGSGQRADEGYETASTDVSAAQSTSTTPAAADQVQK